VSQPKLPDLPSMLATTAARHPQGVALSYVENGEWRHISWASYRDQVDRAARGLIALGLKPGGAVVIASFNRPEWLITHLATTTAGALPTGLYTTSTPEQCAHVVRHAQAEIVVIEHTGLLDQLEAVRQELMSIVVLRGTPPEGCISWSQLLDLGDTVDPALLEQRRSAIKPSDVCSLIYTSGTTGNPKGVRLTHANVLWMANSLVDSFGVGADLVILSYLPLSHIAEQIMSIYLPLVCGGRTAFAESLDALGDALIAIRPTAFLAVPRVWEKIKARMEAAGEKSGTVRRMVVRWARGVGSRAVHSLERGNPLPRTYPLARISVFNTVRQRLGLDRADFFFTSAAPIGRDTLDFFLSLGVPVLEVYGLSECAGPSTISSIGEFRTGSVGRPLPGTEIRLAGDGEVLIRGPHVFDGYHRDPDATDEALDTDGWLHTGDIGTIDDDGYLYIVDRKKEIIVTSGGKNVAPVRIEALLHAIPGIAQAVVIGDRRSHLAALLAFDPDRLTSLAQRLGSPVTDLHAAADCRILRAYLEKQVAQLNTSLAPYEAIRRFAVLPRQLSVDADELTPTLKLKRRRILERWRRLIDEMYAAPRTTASTPYTP